MFTDALQFLIETFFNLYLYIVVLRLLLQAVRIHFANPLVQFANRYTQPMVGPLQRLFPEFKRIDLAIVVLGLALEMLKFFLLTQLGPQSFSGVDGLFLLSLGDFLRHISTFYFYAIILNVLLRLFILMRYHPLVFTLGVLTEPLLRPIRRIVPLASGFDLSPLIVLFLLQVFEMTVVRFLMVQGGV